MGTCPLWSRYVALLRCGLALIRAGTVHTVWQHNLDILTAAGVTFVDIQTGRTGQPAAVPSGTGGDVIAAFDPAWVLAPAGQPARKS
ncbi:MAG: hypothetical protein ACRDTA_21285 [Pseudonocardiaceae bacterium]